MSMNFNLFLKNFHKNSKELLLTSNFFLVGQLSCACVRDLPKGLSGISFSSDQDRMEDSLRPKGS